MPILRDKEGGLNMNTANNVLLVRVPAQETVDGRELRDYILESLAQGVLVLTEDASC